MAPETITDCRWGGHMLNSKSLQTTGGKQHRHDPKFNLSIRYGNSMLDGNVMNHELTGYINSEQSLNNLRWYWGSTHFEKYSPGATNKKTSDQTWPLYAEALLQKRVDPRYQHISAICPVRLSGFLLSIPQGKWAAQGSPRSRSKWCSIKIGGKSKAAGRQHVEKRYDGNFALPTGMQPPLSIFLPRLKVNNPHSFATQG
jgi:hypothetical protein